MVNIPHPLLELGLVIIDTPGLNAIGSEPELTLNLIPSAHAVLFVLAADAGVTRTDIEIWRDHISPAHRSGRFVVLNKIDGLWDELKQENEINLEIAGQVASVGKLLDLPTARIYPVSAQKALVGKIQGDDKLLRRSRLPELEHALSEEMIPQQQAIVRDQVRREFEETAGVTMSVLSARHRNQVEQVFELNGLRGKNKTVIDQMSRRIRAERTDFEKSLRQLQALRTVFSRHSQALFSHVGLDNLKRHVRDSRDLMRASQLSTQLRDGMSNLIASVRIDFEEGDKLVREVTTMMTAMYQSFSRDHGLTLGTPLPFSSRRYFAEIERISQLHQRQFGVMSLLTDQQVGADAAVLRIGRRPAEGTLRIGGARARRLAARVDDAGGEPGQGAPGAVAPPPRVGAARDGCERVAGFQAGRTRRIQDPHRPATRHPAGAGRSGRLRHGAARGAGEGSGLA